VEQLIEVTQVHINDAIRGIQVGTSLNPVALALTEAVGLPMSVHGNTAEPTYQRFERRIRLPKGCVDWITEFDKGHKVQPFSFTIGEDTTNRQGG